MYSPDRTSDGAPLLEQFEMDERAELEMNEKHIEQSAFWDTWFILTPSFLQGHTNSHTAQRPHPTAWLDGLRGIASFLVYIYHFQHMFHQSFNLGYGSNNGDNDHWLIQLPIIRLIVNGQVQVATFYVLSGVSLSLKPLRLARSRAFDTFFDTIFSSVFRRALRLYLPVLAVQIGVLLATLLGLYNHAYALSQDWPYGGTNELMHTVFDSNWVQTEDWMRAMWHFADPFITHQPRLMYDVHTWTIPIEFRNSCILFVALVGFSKLKARIRMSLTAVLWVYCMCHTIIESETALFMAGMVIAEFMVIQEESAKQSRMTDASTKSWSKRADVQCAFWCVVGLFGLHLLSWPPWNADRTSGYRTLARMTPRFTDITEYFWQRIGAAVFVFALSGSSFLRHPFQTSLAVYLGRISFPLYIVHGPLNHTLGLWLVEMFFKVTGSESFAGYETGIILAFCTEAVVVVWLADLVMRTVDGPSVKFGRWLQSKWEVRG
ncbi:hypothetical protein P171DRAFT_427715 [Karstenula rhodostoma CBS 690.94]|uniref:Acyltransferase 3 domain-containing protein n=1 Tax=Karstenula rhodostoma CBS 690.94 TaxID=1392251 RepID=A0A9P4PVG0_9PLEO|nr:hypothetical protein P171DRAFT_427715 [Karstenula rhodostoma CBS 690.94]